MNDHALLWWTAIGSVGTAMFTLALWLVAWRTLSGAKDQLRLIREQAEREGRPYIAADVTPGLHGAGNYDLVIANMGRTAALNLTFHFDAWPSKDDDDYITPALHEYLNATHMFVPGARRRLMWRSVADPEALNTEAGADARARLAVRYEDEQGKVYTDEFTLDADLYGSASPSPEQGPQATAPDADLKRINQSLRTLSTHVGELRR